MAAILSARNVTKLFGGLVAVSDFGIEVEENSISSVIGPNGAGKTTFFNCITGFYKPEKGEIVFDGHYLQGMSTERVTRFGISRTYQNIRLFENMSAVENILVGQHPHLKTFWFEAIFKTGRFVREEREAHKEALRLLEFVGLPDISDQLRAASARTCPGAGEPPQTASAG
jgi:branched-chain amino acid transport system ATP-binding protein